jgi:hypothetical protein
MSNFIPAVELIYREIARPKPPEPKPAHVDEVRNRNIERADVDAILRRERLGTSEELEHIITNAKEYKLTFGEKNQLSVDLTVAIARRARQVNGRQQDPNTRFIVQTLGLLPTPFGLVDRQFVEAQLQTGAQAITRCRNHRPPKCQCWSGQREILWQAQSAHGERSPEGWAATRIYESLEELESAARLEREL